MYSVIAQHARSCRQDASARKSMRVVFAHGAFALRCVHACVHAWLGEITINICTGLGNRRDRARVWRVSACGGGGGAIASLWVFVCVCVRLWK